MAIPTRLQTWYNVDRQAFCDRDGTPLAIEQLPRITLTQQALLCLTCMHDDGTAATFGATDTFSWAADDDWDAGSGPLLLTDDDAINDPTHWAEAAAVDGKLGILIDADSATLQAALGTAEVLPIHGELKVYAAGSTRPYFIGHMELRARNLVDSGGSAPPAVPGDYFTKAEVTAQLVAMLASAAATELTLADGVITPINQHHTLDTEGDAASDELAAIVDWTGFLLLRLANAARVVTLMHGTGADQITCPGAANLPMDYHSLYLLHRATTSDPWRIVGGGGTPLDIGALTDGTSAQTDDLFVVERAAATVQVKIDPMSQGEAETGTATTPRLLTAEVLKAAVLEHAPGGSGGAPSVAAYRGPYQNVNVPGAYRTVTIDAELSDPDNIAAVASNQIQIAGAGAYRMRVWMAGNADQPLNAEARIRDVTNGVELAYVSRYLSAGYGATDFSMETALFELTGAANIEVQLYVQSDYVEIGGTSYDPTSRGTYLATRVILEKVA